MAISFVNKSAFASGTGALTVGAVSGVVADDLIILFVESANENIDTPTGFTQVTNSPVSTGTAASAGGVRLAVFYRWATGADTTTSVADSGNHTTAIKMAFRGVDRTTPFDATPVSGIKTPASTSSSFPGITTATANAWIVHASALDLDAASTATTGTPTNANLIELTERHDQTVTSGVGGGLVIITGEKVTSGATGNTTASVTSTIQVYLTMALREQLLAEIVGSGAATDADLDTAAGLGDVLVQGDGAATDAFTDTASATGTVSDAAITGAGAATESTTDTASGAGDVLIKGSGAATGTGTDAAASTGDVLVQGAGAATGQGTDTAQGTGDVIVQGSAALQGTGSDTANGIGTSSQLAIGAGGAQESTTDTAAGAGDVLVNGSAAISDAFTDTAAGLGVVRVAGSGALLETGADVASGDGDVFVTGSASAVESGADQAYGSGGMVPTIGYGAATETSADTVQGYVLPGYVEPGYTGGTSGTVGTTFTVTGAQALLLRRLCQLHGLIDPLLVGPTERRSGDLVQSVTESGESVTIATVSGDGTFHGNPGQMIEELAALHGLTTELTVTPAGRVAGSIVQSFTASGATTVVTRQ